MSYVHDSITKELADVTARIAELELVLSNSYKLIDFDRSVDNSYRLTHEERFWFAEIDWLNVIGEGESPEEAIRDLESQIDHFIAFYNEQEPDQLTEYANKLKAKFSTLVRL